MFHDMMFPHCGNYGNLHNLTPFWQKFRKSNIFTKENTKYIVDLTTLFLVRLNFCNFQCAVRGILDKYFLKT